VSERGGTAGIGNRLFPTRFLVFLALLPVAFLVQRAVFGTPPWADAAAMAFDAAALVFLVSLLPLLLYADAPTVREHSAGNDANRVLMLGLTTLVVFAVMGAITGELPDAREGDTAAIAKLIATLVLIWLFANSMFALHYAHAFYAQEGGGDAGGLAFPGTEAPDYGDFAYFAFTLGMTFQTSDVAITSRALRHVALLHCFTAFVFNIGVIAFAINALGGG
jgi:uncharacterized membrane protein